MNRDIKELNERVWWIRYWGREFQAVGIARVKTEDNCIYRLRNESVSTTKEEYIKKGRGVGCV